MKAQFLVSSVDCSKQADFLDRTSLESRLLCSHAPGSIPNALGYPVRRDYTCSKQFSTHHALLALLCLDNHARLTTLRHRLTCDTFH